MAGAAARMIETVARPRLRLAATATVAALPVLAVVLRLVGIRFGLPAVYNPDEIAIMSRALAFATGDLNPHNFLYPTFYFYVLFGWIGGYYVLGRLTGGIASLDAFQTEFFTDPSAIYLAGRLLSVACGAATVAAVFALGRRLFSLRAGMLAALFLAVAPFHVRDSHYVKHDVPATLAIVVAYLAIARVWAVGAELARPGPAKAGPYVLEGAPRFFTPSELALVDELSELIVPADDHSPGAKAAGVARYIDGRLAEALLPAAQESHQLWRDGLARVDALAREMHAKPFMTATVDERVAVLTAMSRNERDPKTLDERFFAALKGATVHAYYTSKIGIHQEMEYKGNTLLAEFTGDDPM